MLTILLGAALSVAGPSGDVEQPCEVFFDQVVPSLGGMNVPLDAVVSVLPQGNPCGGDTLTVTVAVNDEAERSFDRQLELGRWMTFPEIELEPNSDYVVQFELDDGYLSLAFTTSDQVAGDPVPPQMTITALEGVDYEGEIGVYMNATIQANLGDLSGTSTLRVTVEDRLDTVLWPERGSVLGSGQWVEARLPEEVCFTGRTVNLVGVESDPVTRCAAPAYTLIPRDLDEGGCQCSSSGSAGWVGLVLLPLFFFRRRRS